MKRSILKQLEEKLDQLTPAQHTVALYVLKNPTEVSFLTVEQLAAETRVSVATVMRLAYALGFSGYAELHKELQELVVDGTSPPNRFAVKLKNLSNNQLLLQCGEKQIGNIQNTIEMISDLQAKQAVEMIRQAKKVYIIGLRSSSAPAYYLEEGLNRVGINSEILVPESSRLQSLLASMTEESLVIAVSLPRYARKTLEIARIAHDQGAKILAITDSFQSPFMEFAESYLPCAYESLAFHNSSLGAIFVADYLVTAVALAESKKSKKELERIEKIVTKMKANLYK